MTEAAAKRTFAKIQHAVMTKSVFGGDTHRRIFEAGVKRQADRELRELQEAALALIGDMTVESARSAGIETLAASDEMCQRGDHELAKGSPLGPLHACSHSSSVHGLAPRSAHSRTASSCEATIVGAAAGSFGYGSASIAYAPSFTSTRAGSTAASRPSSPGVLPLANVPAGMSSVWPAIVADARVRALPASALVATSKNAPGAKEPDPASCASMVAA